MYRYVPSIGGFVLSLAWFLFAGALNASERLPNVVLLIGDDHGYPYFGFMDDPNVVTPTMDAIAEGGITFTLGHASASYCRPSLRTLITGLHPVQYSMRKDRIVANKMQQQDDYDSLSSDAKLARDQVIQASALREFDTLPKLLGELGYASWQGGKWWENSYRNGHFTEGMTQGWDEETVEGEDLFLYMMGAEGTELGRTTMEPLFDFVSRHQDEPMFIWYGPQLPHTPLDAPYKYTKFYEHKDLSQSAKDYYANITWWDDGVSQLMDHIEQHGLLDDTIFIYISDNGWQQDANIEYRLDVPDYELQPEYAAGGFVGKGGLYDMSFRSPIIFYWRNHLRHSFDTTSLVRAEDIVPTILDIVGAQIPDGLPGYSLQPLLRGEATEQRDAIVGYNDRRRSNIADDMGGQIGPQSSGFYVRTHRWHYISRNDGTRELYEVNLDQRASNNLIEQYSELVPAFERRIGAWKESMGMTGWVRLD